MIRLYLKIGKVLGIKSVKKRERTYLDEDPTILYSNDNTNIRVIVLLKNESISDLRSIEVNKKLYCVTNTCAYYGIIHIAHMLIVTCMLIGLIPIVQIRFLNLLLLQLEII